MTPARRSGRLGAAGGLVVLALVAPAAAGTAPAPQTVRVVEVDGSALPRVDVVVAAPRLDGQRLDDVPAVVTGEGVRRSVTLTRLTEGDLAVAVIVDTAVPPDRLRVSQGAVAELLLQLPPAVPVAVTTAGSGTPASATSPAGALSQLRALAASDRPLSYPDVLARLQALPPRPRRVAVVIAEQFDSTLTGAGREALQALQDSSGSVVYSIALGRRLAGLAQVAADTGGLDLTPGDGQLVRELDRVADELNALYRTELELQTPSPTSLRLILDGPMPGAAAEVTLSVAAVGRRDPGVLPAAEDAAAPARAVVVSGAVALVAFAVLSVRVLGRRHTRRAFWQ